jgi:hypothetical protein
MWGTGFKPYLLLPGLLLCFAITAGALWEIVNL